MWKKKEQRAYLKDTFDVYERSQRIMNQARSVYLRLAQEYDNMYIIPCMDENGVFKSIEEIADLVMKKIMEK